MNELKMPDVNSVIIAGHLTCDPSFRKTTNGTPVANFYITCNRKFKDNNGQWRENVCYVGVVAWYKLAESCFESLKRGSAVLVDGELQSRSWRSEDGTTRNVVEIKARRIQFLNRKAAHDNETELSDEYKQKDNDLRNREFIDSNEDTQNTEEVGEERIEESQQEEKVPETDFDFGYRGLKL